MGFNNNLPRNKAAKKINIKEHNHGYESKSIISQQVGFAFAFFLSCYLKKSKVGSKKKFNCLFYFYLHLRSIGNVDWKIYERNFCCFVCQRIFIFFWFYNFLFCAHIQTKSRGSRKMVFPK